MGGLCAALSLLQRGFRVRLFERAGTLSEVGAGLHVSPNGTRVLLALGLGEAAEAVAAKPQQRVIRLWSSGQTWELPGLGATARDRYGSPYYLMHRADLQAILAEGVRRIDPGAIVLNARCEGFEQTPAGVALVLADGTKVEGDALVGADGIHSAVRRQLFGPHRAEFTGDIAWRGLIPRERLPDRMLATVATNWIGPNASATIYPVRRGEMLNFVGHAKRGDWREESWLTPGTVAECQADFPGWHRDVMDIIAAIDMPYKWGLFIREPMARWGEGRVSLLGDACHATLPYLAQGANMAIEDGYVLGRCLEAHREDLPRGLRAYEAARRERTAQVIRRSTEMSKRFHNDALATAEGAVAYVEREWHPDNVRARYDWIYSYDATSVGI